MDDIFRHLGSNGLVGSASLLSDLRDIGIREEPRQDKVVLGFKPTCESKGPELR